MKLKRTIRILTLVMGLQFIQVPTQAHEIFFCGERIPLNDEVAKKLMNIIKKQVNYGLLSQLRLKTSDDMRVIEEVLRLTGLPQDIKYLAVVESGFRNVESSAGAVGFWQLMPDAARQWGLIINSIVDERLLLRPSTYAACQHLTTNYKKIKADFGVYSWVLAAAAYNVGLNAMQKQIKRQGNNYFEMSLNKETAEYVYKIIAVKELFEYPELYMKDFGFNVFNNRSASTSSQPNSSSNDADFADMKVDVQNSEKMFDSKDEKTKKQELTPKNVKESFIFAHITGNYSDFKDSTVVSVELENDLIIDGTMTGKGETIKGAGWIVDGKAFIDFGFGKKLLLMDITTNAHDGILLSNLLDKKEIMLKITEYRN